MCHGPSGLAGVEVFFHQAVPGHLLDGFGFCLIFLSGHLFSFLKRLSAVTRKREQSAKTASPASYAGSKVIFPKFVPLPHNLRCVLAVQLQRI